MLWKKGNFDGAVEQYQRALANREEKAPNSLDLARCYDIPLGLQHIITKFDDTYEDVMNSKFPDFVDPDYLENSIKSLEDCADTRRVNKY